MNDPSTWWEKHTTHVAYRIIPHCVKLCFRLQRINQWFCDMQHPDSLKNINLDSSLSTPIQNGNLNRHIFAVVQYWMSSEIGTNFLHR